MECTQISIFLLTQKWRPSPSELVAQLTQSQKRNVCDCLSNIILHCDIVVAKLQRLLIPLLFIEGKYNCIFIKKFSI